MSSPPGPRFERHQVGDRLRTEYAEHADAIYGFATALATEPVADDAICQVFVDRNRRASAPDEDGSVRTQLLRAVYQAIGGAPGLMPGEGPPVAERSTLQNALQQLAPAERAAVAAVSFGDGGCGDAAQVLAVAPSVVRADLRRGLVQLRTVLADGQHPDDRRSVAP